MYPVVMIYLVQNRRLWGLFGEYLISGRTTRCHLSPAPMDLERFGPFVPPLYTTHARILVSEATRHAIEQDKPFKVEFRRTHYERVLPLNWHEWDLTADQPQWIPSDRDAENYYFDIMDQMTDDERHRVSTQLAKEMEPSWELILPVIPCDLNWLGSADEFVVDLFDRDYNGLFYPSQHELYPLSDDSAREWLEANVAPWVHFEPMRLIRYKATASGPPGAE